MTANNKKYIFSILAVLLSLFVICAFAEVSIRLRPELYSEGYRRSWNKKIVYELLPGYEVKSVNVKISPQGLNENFYPIKKEQGAYRIAVVGDSTSFGWKVRRQEGFPKILEKMLNEQKTGKFEVINFSVPGYNAAIENELIKARVARFNPDMILWVFCGNDLWMCNYFQPRITLWNFLYNRSAFVRYWIKRIGDHWEEYPTWFRRLWVVMKKDVMGMFFYTERIYPYPGLEEVAYVRLDPPKEKNKIPPEYRYMHGIKNFQKHVGDIKAYLQNHGCLLIVTGFLEPEITSALGRLKMEHVLNWYEIPAMNLPDNYLSKSDPHLSLAGHQLIAKNLYEYLEANFLSKIPDRGI
jgi:lysophospholipase L1-like esterase